MAFSNKYILPFLIAVGLAVPQGVSNIFLPSTRVSSFYDLVDVNLPVISFQFLLIFSYVISFASNIKIKKNQSVFILWLFGLCFFSALFSLSPLGYISYSSLWFVAPFAVYIHTLNSKPNYCGANLISDLRLIALLFSPFYIFDFFASAAFGGLSEFASFTLASNGHSFVSFLFALVFLIQMSGRANTNRKSQTINIVFALMYILGGLLSGGRIALFSFILCMIFLAPVKAVLYLILTSPLSLFLLSKSEKLSLIISVIQAGDFDDFRVWSSGISRLNFWTTYLDLFYSNWVSGAGGLAGNLYKYDYNFPYEVFVDPHNELVFLLSGFGISGVAFAFSSISLSYILIKNIKNNCAKQAVHDFEAGKIGVVIFYIFICSMSNANSAKQNIQLLFVFILSTSIPVIIKGWAHNRSIAKSLR